jgi:hypothetical protein
MNNTEKYLIENKKRIKELNSKIADLNCEIADLNCEKVYVLRTEEAVKVVDDYIVNQNFLNMFSEIIKDMKHDEECECKDHPTDLDIRNCRFCRLMELEQRLVIEVAKIVMNPILKKYDFKVTNFESPLF